MEHNNAENDTNGKIATEGLVPLSEGTCTPTNKKSIMKAPGESPGKFSTGPRKAKYALLRTRQKERLFQSKMARLLQTKPFFAESHTEALHRVTEAASALKNQQQIWSDNGTRSEAQVLWFQNSEGYGGKLEYSRPE